MDHLSKIRKNSKVLVIHRQGHDPAGRVSWVRAGVSKS